MPLPIYPWPEVRVRRCMVLRVAGTYCPGRLTVCLVEESDLLAFDGSVVTNLYVETLIVSSGLVM
jgi:hypothetical protein